MPLSHFLSLVSFGLSPTLRTDRPLPNAFRYSRYTYLVKLALCALLCIQINQSSALVQNKIQSIEDIAPLESNDKTLQQYFKDLLLLQEEELNELYLQAKWWNWHSNRLSWIMITITLSFIIYEAYFWKWKRFCSKRTELLEEIANFERENRSGLLQRNERVNNTEAQRFALQRKTKYHAYQVSMIVSLTLVFSILLCFFHFNLFIDILLHYFSHWVARPILPEITQTMLNDYFRMFAGSVVNSSISVHHVSSSIKAWILIVYLICMLDLYVRLRIFVTFFKSYLDYHILPISPPNCAG
jgi:hypothetical protein